jgi:hypothetical protein
MPGIPIPRQPRFRDSADVDQPLLETEAAHDPHRLGIEVDPGADARATAPLLVDIHVMARSLQHDRGGGTAHAAPDDRDAGIVPCRHAAFRR